MEEVGWRSTFRVALPRFNKANVHLWVHYIKGANGP